MQPPIAQRFVPTNPATLHTLYTLADYPVLAALAAERTQATRLDGRACQAIYEDAHSRIDWQAMPPNERETSHDSWAGATRRQEVFSR